MRLRLRPRPTVVRAAGFPGLFELDEPADGDEVAVPSAETRTLDAAPISVALGLAYILWQKSVATSVASVVTEMLISLWTWHEKVTA